MPTGRGLSTDSIGLLWSESEKEQDQGAESPAVLEEEEKKSCHCLTRLANTRLPRKAARHALLFLFILNRTSLELKVRGVGGDRHTAPPSPSQHQATFPLALGVMAGPCIGLRNE